MAQYFLYDRAQHTAMLSATNHTRPLLTLLTFLKRKPSPARYIATTRPIFDMSSDTTDFRKRLVIGGATFGFNIILLGIAAALYTMNHEGLHVDVDALNQVTPVTVPTMVPL